MGKVLAGILAAVCLAGAGPVYVWKKKSFETRYVFVAAGPDSARVLRFAVVKGLPRKEWEAMLPKIDSGVFAGEGGRFRIWNQDSAEIRFRSKDQALHLRATTRSELDSLMYRAAFGSQRSAMIHMLKGGLPRTVEAGLFYDRQARSHGIPEAMSLDSAAFDSVLAAFNKALLDSVMRGNR